MDFSQSIGEKRRFAVEGSLPSQSVTRAIADLEESDPVDLPPLYDSIDPDRLDALYEYDDVQISFSYAGYRVTVTDAGVIVIECES